MAKQEKNCSEDDRMKISRATIRKFMEREFKDQKSLKPEKGKLYSERPQKTTERQIFTVRQLSCRFFTFH